MWLCLDTRTNRSARKSARHCFLIRATPANSALRCRAAWPFSIARTGKFAPSSRNFELGCESDNVVSAERVVGSNHAVLGLRFILCAAGFGQRGAKACVERELFHQRPN